MVRQDSQARAGPWRCLDQLFKFEVIHGTPEQQEDVKSRCVQAEPKHGELWCKYSKNLELWQKKIDFFLTVAAKELMPPT